MRSSTRVHVCPIHLPGREERLAEQPYTDLQTLAGVLADVLATQLDLPFAFVGHSMGALLSFELARSLRRKYRVAPASLYLLACRAPTVADPVPPLRDAPDDVLIGEMKRLGGTSSAVFEHEELMSLILPTLRSDLVLCETYQYKDEAPLDCPISIFGGLQDEDLGTRELYPWRAQTNGRFRLRYFEGDHFFLRPAEADLFATILLDLAGLALRGGAGGVG
jgi:medium-chain acyl-[acyl-carrier-protein] hydrolase